MTKTPHEHSCSVTKGSAFQRYLLDRASQTDGHGDSTNPPPPPTPSNFVTSNTTKSLTEQDNWKTWQYFDSIILSKYVQFSSKYVLEKAYTAPPHLSAVSQPLQSRLFYVYQPSLWPWPWRQQNDCKTQHEQHKVWQCFKTVWLCKAQHEQNIIKQNTTQTTNSTTE